MVSDFAKKAARAAGHPIVFALAGGVVVLWLITGPLFGFSDTWQLIIMAGCLATVANIYLHYVFDLWADRWRKCHARGQVIIVRYADDIVMGFEHEGEARRFVAANGKVRAIVRCRCIRKRHD